MTTRQKILDYLAKHDSATSRDLCNSLNISRQAVNVHMRELINSGRVVKAGSTRAAYYYLAERVPQADEYQKTFSLNGLDESHIYEQVAITLNLNSALRDNLESVVNYAFTEMLNNAIDHSAAKKCHVRVKLDAASLNFEILDRGIGVFESIAEKLELEDEHAAMIELIKGKTTTMPEAHSGEGIFFTSKAADKFSLQSHSIKIDWDRARDDVFVSKTRYQKGTRVNFQLRRDSRTKLESVFAEFAPEEYDYQFLKTKVQIKLLKTEYISRSEARRLLLNLDKFSEIELDFKGVAQMGQGFADEVFRIFATKHPQIKIHAVNTDSVIEAMISHVSQPN